MKVTIDKLLIPVLNQKISGIKSMEQYKFAGYNQTEAVLEAPSGDLPIGLAIDIGRLGAVIENYEYWIEVDDVNLTDDVPAGLSFSTYLNDDPVPIEVNRKWNELGELAASFVVGKTMRYWQPSSDGVFIWEDVEILIESGFKVFGKASLDLQLNKEYSNTGDPEYVVQETIEYIDQNWRFAGYFDFVAAYFAMDVIYTAKGASDLARWNACTTAEKIILVKWNQVGLNRAASIAPGGWSEGRTLKELSRLYREFNDNTRFALDKRFNDWYQYLQLSLSTAGRTKFKGDWDWDLREEYINNGLRFYELGDINALVDWHNTVLATYGDADFVGVTLTAADLTDTLLGVLSDSTYFI